jgi:hypothetical protein
MTVSLKLIYKFLANIQIRDLDCYRTPRNVTKLWQVDNAKYLPLTTPINLSELADPQLEMFRLGMTGAIQLTISFQTLKTYMQRPFMLSDSDAQLVSSNCPFSSSPSFSHGVHVQNYLAMSHTSISFFHRLSNILWYCQ